MKNNLIYSTHTEANVGDQVDMECLADKGYGDLHWEFNHGTPTYYVKFIDRYNVDINPVHLNNSGSYTCSGWKNNHKFLATTKLKVFGKFSRLWL